MYATCLFCSASLGKNEAIETFPVGSRVAFDAGRGRLWAVCARCGRWNLAPIEERWEAVEAAERLFTDTRSRVHSENIGLARLRDGTRLVRVGAALPGELAAWRYGDQLISRRRRDVTWTVAGVGAAGAVIAGIPLLASAGVPLVAMNLALQLSMRMHERHQRNRVVTRLHATDSPTGADLVIRRWHLVDATLGATDAGELALDLPPVVRGERRRDTDVRRAGAGAGDGIGADADAADPVRITGDTAARVAARSMLDYNSGGATSPQIERALSVLAVAGGAEAFVRATAQSGAVIAGGGWREPRRPRPYSPRQILGTFRGEILPVQKYGLDPSRHALTGTEALALEMALHEEAERRALEGELAALEAAWREAEEIAQIADALPDRPEPERRLDDPEQQRRQ
jgi:hypothetical protein